MSYVTWEQEKVCTTYIGGEEFSVPAVTSVMRHFIEHVLPEADLIWISPNLQQEEEHAAEKVTHGLGTNNFLRTNQTCFSTRTVPSARAISGEWRGGGWKQTFRAAAQRIRNLTRVIYYKALHRKNNHASTNKRRKKAFLLGSNEPLTWLTASPTVISSGGFPSIWCSDGNNLSVWELTFSNLGWLLSLGSTKCSISARVNSLHKKK